MASIPFQAVAVDMDGTFLNENSVVDRAAFQTVFPRLKQERIHFIIASGNELKRCRRDLGPFAAYCDYVCENGALVAAREKVIYRHPLKARLVDQALTFIEQNYPQAKIILSSENHAYILENDDASFKKQFYHAYVTGREVKDLHQYEQGVLKITLNVSVSRVKEIVAAFAKKYGHQIKGISGGGPWMDLINPDDDKSNGLRRLLDYYQIPLNQLLVFGDGGNDIRMLKMTPLSYAMANGTIDAKRAARHLAPSNRENGVVKVLQQYLY